MQPKVQFKDKKVLLTAFSTTSTSESRALYSYLKAHGCSSISALYWGGEVVAQQIPSDVKKKAIDSPDDIKDIDLGGYDVVFRHQTVHPDKLKNAKQIMTATELFFQECPVPIIGVTGTKGKGTTSTLISKILENAGITNWLLGNVGLPALQLLSEIQEQGEGIVVFEISSFQLWDIQQSPETAVVLLIEPDHLDVHKSFKEYVDAKKGITKWQNVGDMVVYHPANKYSKQIAEASPAENKKRFLTTEGAYIKNKQVVIDDSVICDVKDIALPGEHNWQNVCAAITAAWRYTKDREAFKRAIQQFHGLEHRLRFVKEVKGVKYYNDSISTTVGSAIAALRAFDGRKIIILGGSSKSADFSDLIKEVNARNVGKALLIGDEAKRIAGMLEEDKYEIMGKASLSSVVGRAAELAQTGDVVILSPACASFDMFENYQDRGQQFIKAVSDLGD